VLAFAASPVESWNRCSFFWVTFPCKQLNAAWTVGKFSGATVGKFTKSIGLDDRVKNRKIVMPGYVSQINGELE
jgi:CO dehydrogenase/acetyl-CoA synthase gamma subunit (corrinoid Fe-S protein)